MKFLKEAVTDPEAVQAMNMSDTSLRRKLVHGLAADFKNSVDSDLRKNRFSINLDEAEMKNNGEKMLSILASFFSLIRGGTFIYHLDTVRILNTRAETMFAALCEVFTDHGLQWDLLVSMLADNCNSMQGEYSGLVTKVKHVHPNLVDIGGDTIHMIHNTVKKITEPFGGWLESLFNDLYMEFKHN